MEEPILRLDRHSPPKPHILPAQPQVRLEITRGRVRERVRPVTRKVFLLGAASDCDLVIGDLRFPEAYAYLFVSATEVTIRRLGSGPPLLVCGQAVETSELFHGDLIEMGSFELRVVIDGPVPVGDHDDDDGSDELLPTSTGADRVVAINEVRLLLADIRQALGEDSAPLRLYPSPLPLRASA